jgi:hypothetical protein
VLYGNEAARKLRSGSGGSFLPVRRPLAASRRQKVCFELEALPALLFAFSSLVPGCGSRTELGTAGTAPSIHDAGSQSSGTEAGTLVAPRPLAPLSTSTVTTRTPTLHWVLPGGSDGAAIDLCRDRACHEVITSFTATGAAGTPPMELPSGIVFWRLRGALHGVPSSAYSPTWELAVRRRSSPVDTSWGTILDLNGDGYADLAVGAPGANGDVGVVYLYLGSPAGLASTPEVVQGPAQGSDFGSVVSSAGDVNGDGIADLIVGGFGFSEYYVYLGSASGVVAPPEPLTIPPMGVCNELGATAANAGDVNGDGYGDVIVGVACADNDTGAALVYFGSSEGIVGAPQVLGDPAMTQGDSFAGTVASAGDVNGDGFGDVAVSSTAVQLATGFGATYVYLGGPQGVRTTPFNTLVGVAGILCASDVNGDGFADLIASIDALGTTANIYLGSASGYAAPPQVVVAPNPSESIGDGPTLANAGDIDGDGYDDVLLGSFTSNQAYLYYGGPTGLGITPTLLADPNGGANDNFSLSVAGAGDVDGDGYPDVVVAAPDTLGGGVVYLFSGGAGGERVTPTRLFKDPGMSGDDSFGGALAE